MPAHIQAHSRMVGEVAQFLTDELALAGVVLDRSLVVAAALLHDITKPRSFSTHENHAQTGGEYLVNLGYREVGDIVRQHIVLDTYFARERPSEAEVVNYADKRVLNDRIVPLEERMAYILERYAVTVDRRHALELVWRQTIRLEQHIFSLLSFPPLELSTRLPAES